MRASRAHRVGIAVALLLAALMNEATAQTPASTPTDEQAPATVVIAAPRPVNLDGYRAAEARIRKVLASQPASSSPFLSWCMEHRFADENASFPGTPVPVATKKSLDLHIKCARTHIEAEDSTLKQGLEAFDRRDYATALGLFEKAYAKMGTQDAALMLARMHVDGLGTPKDRVAGIKWLREVAEDRFDPWRDTLRFDPKHPGAMNARIEAAMMLARIYEQGDGVARDWQQAQRWHAKAVEFGYAPALDDIGHPGQAAPGPDKLPADRHPAEEALENMAPVASQATVAVVAPVPDQQALAAAVVAPAPDKPALPAPHLDKPASAAAAADPQDQTEAGAFMRVRVTGLRAVAWKSYRAMRAGVMAYEEHKALAPDAMFSFAALPPAGSALPPNFKLRVRTKDGKEYPVTLQDGELFQLPLLPDPGADADLVSNLKGGQLRIGLLVHTRGVPPEKERLGDVRLREEINQAIADVDDPGIDRACRGKRRGHNDCRLPRAGVWFKPRAPASGAWLVVGDRREALKSNDDGDYPAYRMPVNAGHLGNDVLIEFDYKVPLGPVKVNAVLMAGTDD